MSFGGGAYSTVAANDVYLPVTFRLLPAPLLLLLVPAVKYAATGCQP
jgi:hypothetical protein